MAASPLHTVDSIVFASLRQYAPQLTHGSLAHTSVSCKQILFDPVGLRVSMCIIVPNLVKTGQTIAEIWLLNGFQNFGRTPSWNFLKSTSYWRIGLRGSICVTMVKPLLRYHDFSIFKIVAVRQSWIFKSVRF